MHPTKTIKHMINFNNLKIMCPWDFSLEYCRPIVSINQLPSNKVQLFIFQIFNQFAKCIENCLCTLKILVDHYSEEVKTRRHNVAQYLSFRSTVPHMFQN